MTVRNAPANSITPPARRQLSWPVGDNYPGRWKRGMVGLAFGAGFGLGVVVQHSRGAPRLC